MPFSAIEQYLARLDARQAETRLLLADVAMLPYMEKGDRRMNLKMWMRKAKTRSSEQLRVPSMGQLKMMGIGVEVTDGQV